MSQCKDCRVAICVLACSCVMRHPGGATIRWIYTLASVKQEGHRWSVISAAPTTVVLLLTQMRTNVSQIERVLIARCLEKLCPVRDANNTMNLLRSLWCPIQIASSWKQKPFALIVSLCLHITHSHKSKASVLSRWLFWWQNRSGGIVKCFGRGKWQRFSGPASVPREKMLMQHLFF